MNLIQWLKNKHILHSWEEIGLQEAKGWYCSYGFPAERVVFKCSRCGKIKYIYLNLRTQYKIRLDDTRWSPSLEKLIEEK